MNQLPGDYQRTAVYAAVDHQNPKHLFKVIGRRLQALLGANTQPRVLDVGGASGALAGYLKQCFPSAQISSLDFDPELCAIGRQHYPDITFIDGDANDMSTLDDMSFDAITMVGTLSVFDEFEPSLSECLRLITTGGSILVVGQFNRHPVDALIRYRYSEEKRWNTGYNLFSQHSISSFLETNTAVKKHTFIPFELPFDLHQQEDPIRSWTVKMPNGSRELRNGINLIIDLQILEINL